VKPDWQTAVKYADDLAKKNSEALSFIPRPQLENYARRGRLLVAHENGDPCGFLIHGNGPVIKIYQACVQYDARRREHGLEMVRRLVEKAIAQQATYISLWCADDLDSNSFWRDAGFHFAGQRPGGARRHRIHNRWVMPLAFPLFVQKSLLEDSA
jgi:ribosomal protein S18 acetylase RimI-like enzyme